MSLRPQYAQEIFFPSHDAFHDKLKKDENKNF